MWCVGYASHGCAAAYPAGVTRPRPRRELDAAGGGGAGGAGGAGDASAYEPMARAVARHLRDAIYDGKLARGAPIRQEAVAQELGVSRIPVREALRELEVEGLVTIRPHSGARVAVLDFAECVELYMIRERIEPLAFGDSVDNLSPDQAADLAKLAQRIEELKGDGKAWIEADRQFHVASYAGARLPRLLDMVVSFWNTTQQYRRIQVDNFSPEDFRLFHSDHALMLDAVERGNRRGGEEAVRAHIERSRLWLSQRRELFDQ